MCDRCVRLLPKVLDFWKAKRKLVVRITLRQVNNGIYHVEKFAGICMNRTGAAKAFTLSCAVLAPCGDTKLHAPSSQAFELEVEEHLPRRRRISDRV